MLSRKKTKGFFFWLISVLICLKAHSLNTPFYTTAPLESFLTPISDTNSLSYSQRIELVKVYIDADMGKAALDTLSPLMHGKPQYQVTLLAAQCYAELNRPSDSLKYYELARDLAKSEIQLAIAAAGIKKMQLWINGFVPSYISPIPRVYFVYDERIKLIKQYINENKGNEALKEIKPILKHVESYDIYLLAAQAYAESDNPKQALYYFQLAQRIAKSTEEIKVAKTGINKMQLWISTNKKKPTIREISAEEVSCKELIMRGKSLSTCIQQIRLTKQYLSLDKGQYALDTLNPLLMKQSNFLIDILAAQAYAEVNNPRLALTYYKAALLMAKKPQEIMIALFGIGKMQFWLGKYYTAVQVYQRILKSPTNSHDNELAKAGLIKSLAYMDRTILAYRLIPSQLVFTTPEMVIAAAQATLWADQADLTKKILSQYQFITKKIVPKTGLWNDLKDVQWQMKLNTNPNTLTPNEFYSEDSDHFSVLRSTLDYSHYSSQQYQYSIGFKQSRYKQVSQLLNAEGIYFQQKWRPTRELTFNGKVEPTTYQLWNPFLWNIYSNYKPNDYIQTGVLAQKEVVETFPAFTHHITANQYSANLFISPLPYIKINGSLNRLNFSDRNIRNGYYISTSTVLSTVYGLNLILQRRGYTDKFVSPYYFSPNQYSTNTIILRVGSKAGSVWHYYVDGGIGNQSIGLKNTPTATSPTHQFGFGLNGPIGQYLILNAYYAFTQQASSFINSPGYTYQYGAISINVLL